MISPYTPMWPPTILWPYCTKHVKEHIHMFIFTSGLLHVVFKCHNFLWLTQSVFSLPFLTLYSPRGLTEPWAGFQQPSTCRPLQPELSFELRDHIFSGLPDIFSSLFQNQLDPQSLKLKSHFYPSNLSSSRDSCLTGWHDNLHIRVVKFLWVFLGNFLPSPFISELSLNPNEVTHK